MSIIALIPARSGSKSVPGKNIKKLAKYPLIAYSIAMAKMSDRIERVIVNTDSQEIADISVYYGAEVPFLRPKEISGDFALDIEYCVHFIDFLKVNNEAVPEFIVHLRPTTPLRIKVCIEKAIDMVMDNSSATALRSGHLTHISPYKIFWMDGVSLNGFFPDDTRKEYYNLPRQVFPQTFIPNGHIDILKTDTINQGMLHGDDMIGLVTEEVPDIDVLSDYDYAKRAIIEPRFCELLDFMEETYN
jgi:CMP-N,N'-diacetyllegionaminic acid synthase